MKHLLAFFLITLEEEERRRRKKKKKDEVFEKITSKSFASLGRDLLTTNIVVILHLSFRICVWCFFLQHPQSFGEQTTSGSSWSSPFCLLF